MDYTEHSIKRVKVPKNQNYWSHQMKKILFTLLLIFTVSNEAVHAGGAAISKPLDIQEINHIFTTVKKADHDEVMELIRNKATANATLPEGLTILQFAVTLGLNEIVRILIQKGADVTTRNYLGNTALHYAVKTQTSTPSEDVIRQRADIIEQLIKAGANIYAENLKRQTPFNLVKSAELLEILEENHSARTIGTFSESIKK